MFTGGPQEYLVLKENEISFDGEDCDKAGVTYATYARQAHRCQREAGSCLKNQPLHFWQEDKVNSHVDSVNLFRRVARLYYLKLYMGLAVS